MPVAPDPHSTFGSYAHPDRLVTTEWLSANIGAPGLKIIESNEDILLYDIGHVPGAVKIDWRTELIDPRTRDVIDGERFAGLMRAKGVERDDTVVLYGDKYNSTAAATLWVFALFGHQDVRLLDGGRDAWISEGRDTAFEVPYITGPGEYPIVDRDDKIARAFREDVVAQLGGPLVDVRVFEEYTGELVEIERADEQALRSGHIPTAVNIPWTSSVGPDSRFRPRAELDVIYGGVADGGAPIVYARIGERSAHCWFVLTHLLGVAGVRNYDGSWTEWANLVGAPIVTGEEPGAVPAIASRS